MIKMQTFISLLFIVPGAVMLIAPDMFFKGGKETRSNVSVAILRILGVILLIAGMFVVYSLSKNGTIPPA